VGTNLEKERTFDNYDFGKLCRNPGGYIDSCNGGG
jgi:hypothetical protein